MISSRLKLNKRLYARKCEIKQISNLAARKFFDNNHLQGFVGGATKLGLYHNGELVQAIIIGKSRYNKKYNSELIRSATLKGYNVVGGISKLLNSVKDSIISYADRRYSDGTGYKAIGMHEMPAAPPNYFYLIRGALESRIKYQKYKLINLLEIFDCDKTEAYNMQLNGHYRVWDCGNLVYVKENK